MNVSSAFSGVSSWGGTQAMSQASRRSGASQEDAQMMMRAMQQGQGMQGQPGGPPPGPPPDFDVQRSTADFASSRSGGGDLMSELDADGDGAISAEEVGLEAASAEAQEFFAAIDTDADGSLSETELDDMRSRMEEAMQALLASGGAGGMRAPMGPPPEPPSIASLDADEDGAVSAEEFGLDGASEAVQQLFTEIDSDQDGTLSASEVEAFDSQMQAAMEATRPRGEMGPPPPPDGSSTSVDSSSDSLLADAQQTARQVSMMLQRMAQDYLSLMGDDQGSSSSLSVSA